MGHETGAHLTFGVQDPKPEPIERPVDLVAYVQQDALIRTVLRTLDASFGRGPDRPSVLGDASLPEQIAALVAHVQRQRACLGLLASLADPDTLERYRRVGREQGILGPDWSPEPVSRQTVENVIKAAREVDDLFDGKVDRWTLDDHPISTAASTALLSLHDYLNDVERETGGTL